MSPRAYNLGERQVATQETRARIIAAARALLAAPDGISAFTVDAVARQAGVARMTVYYQFTNKLGLLEALYDDIGEKGLVPRLGVVFVHADPVAALVALVNAFSSFWASEQLVTRRLRALSRLDSEVEQGIQRRDSWRRMHLHNVLTRAATANQHVATAIADPDAEDLIFSLTSFEYFDVVSGLKGAEAAADIIKRLVLENLGLAKEASGG